VDIATIYRKKCDGDHLTDEEVERGLRFFGDLGAMLVKVGPVFSLAATEATRIWQELSHVKDSRVRNNAWTVPLL
jgi:hypothetical protein